MKKRTLSFLLVVVMMLTIIQTGTFSSAAATTTKTKEQVNSWLNYVERKKLGNGWCVGLITEYYKFLGESASSGNAADYVNNYLPDGWERIEGEKNPQLGDVLVWTKGYENYGHVAVCGDNNIYHQRVPANAQYVVKKSKKVGDLNFSTDGKSYIAEYWGVIRPKFKESSNSYDKIDKGNYYIRNKESGKYLKAGKSTIKTADYTGADNQIFKISNAVDAYKLMPLTSEKVVNYKSNKTVNLYTEKYIGKQWWYFKPVDGGYAIVSFKNESVCITSESSGMKVSKYTGADNQIWYLEKQCEITYDANGGSDAPDVQRVKQYNIFTLSTATPTRKCYTFKGWSTEKDATKAQFKAGAKLKATDTVTLYAVWGNAKHKYSDKCDTTCNVCKETREVTHNNKTSVVKKATTSAKGKMETKCLDCGYVSKTTTINSIKTVTLSTKEYIYDGNVKTPTVTVKDSKGNKLIRNVDYKVSYASGRKETGRYSVVVTFMGRYSGKSVLAFTIKPKTPTINNIVSSVKGGVALNWTNVAGESGYQLYYATSKNGTYNKVATYSAGKIVGMKTGLTSGKTYYFKVRAYKTADGGTIYSGWSAVKSIKVK